MYSLVMEPDKVVRFISLSHLLSLSLSPSLSSLSLPINKQRFHQPSGNFLTLMYRRASAGHSVSVTLQCMYILQALMDNTSHISKKKPMLFYIYIYGTHLCKRYNMILMFITFYQNFLLFSLSIEVMSSLLIFM